MQRTRAIASVLALALTGPVAAIDERIDGADDTIFANGFEDYILTIDNFLVWCTISVDGATATPNPPPTPFHPGTVVPLAGAPVSPTFIWGYWVGTDVPGHDTNTNTTVTMNGDRNVFVCCPFANGTGCPATP